MTDFPAPRDPFAARDDALARIHQHLTTESHPQALVFVGRAACGKTALLRAFDTVFDPLNVWGLYIDLKTAPLHDESAWLRLLFTRAYDAALAHGFSAERLPTLPDSVDDLRAWLTETGYPELFRVIRAARRIVYLLDNADALLDALARGTLPATHPAYLQSLLGSQCAMILTVPLADEARLSALAPLVGDATPFRLRHFDTTQVAQVVAAVTNQPLDKTLGQEVAQLSGGQPMLTRYIAEHLARGEALPAAADAVYTQALGFFRQQWDSLNENERRTLSAMAALTYANPLTTFTASALEAWLADSDAPLDLTAVNVALRGLEYHEIIAPTSQGVTLRGELLRRWLIAYARHPSAVVVRPRARPASLPESVPRVLWILLAVGTVLALLVILLAIASLSAGSGAQVVPTVVLN